MLFTYVSSTLYRFKEKSRTQVSFSRMFIFSRKKRSLQCYDVDIRNINRYKTDPCSVT